MTGAGEVVQRVSTDRAPSGDLSSVPSPTLGGLQAPAPSAPQNLMPSLASTKTFIYTSPPQHAYNSK